MKTARDCSRAVRPLRQSPSIWLSSAFADFEPHIAHLPVKRRTANTEAAGHFRHVALILIDREADHFLLDLFELAHIARFIGDRNTIREVGAREIRKRVCLWLHGLRNGSSSGRRIGRLGGLCIPINECRDLREIRNLKHLAVAKHDGAEDRVFKLTHIAWPFIGAEHVERVTRDADNGLSFFRRKTTDEVRDEFGNVIPALAQRRHMDREDIETVIKVFAEAAFLHHLKHVAVRRRDQAEYQP